MSADHSETIPESDLPEAVVSKRGVWGSMVDSGALPIWILTLLSLAIAIGAVISSQRGKGPEITVQFHDGHGLKPGDAVRHRGIGVGEVTSIELSDDFKSVDVEIRLERHAEGIAREGSRFWIQRPRLSLSQMSGLDTVVGAKYVGVWPGEPDGERATKFVGIESPPTLSGADDVQVTVRFKNGFGIDEGAPVKHRGIVVGEVTSVDLDESLDRVVTTVRLVQNGKRIARGGTQFWVERPKLGLTDISGLDTIVGGLYMAVRPGPADSESCAEFEGLEVPPVTLQAGESGLEFIIQSNARESMERGAPITYRGLTVGQILSVGLASDARRVEARVFVRDPFTQLLRTNTEFWSSGGIELSVGPGGIRLEADSLVTVAAGGIAFATPSKPGERVHTGHRFPLLDEAPSDHATWAPRIAVGSPLLKQDTELPRLQRCALSWKAKRLGLSRMRRRNGWLLPLEEGRWVVPAFLSSIPSGAIEDSAQLEVAGVKIPLVDVEAPSASSDGKALVLTFPQTDEIEIARWSSALIRRMDQPEDLVLYTGPQEPQMIVPTNRMTEQNSAWLVDRSLPLDDDWNGAAAIAREDAKLVGVVAVDDGRAWIVPLMPLLSQ